MTDRTKEAVPQMPQRDWHLTEFLSWLERQDYSQFDFHGVVDSFKGPSCRRDYIDILQSIFGHKYTDIDRKPRVTWSTLMISETIFVDVETRPEKLHEYLGFAQLLLGSIARQESVYDAHHLHLIYCSIDKGEILLSLARLINRSNATSRFSRIILVPYSHPKEGYTDDGSRDEKWMPNRYYGRPLKLFSRALSLLPDGFAEGFNTFLRFRLDDDDVWAPWALNELVYNARILIAEDGADVRYLGIPSVYLYYPYHGGQLSLVRMKTIMHGSKVIVSKDWTLLTQRHPWQVVESFSKNTARKYRKNGVDLKLATNARPFFC